MSIAMITALAIFVLTFVLIATEWRNKAVATILGGFVLVSAGIVSQEESFSTFIDWNVLFLLIGMMVIVGVMKTTGLFEYIAIRTAKIAKGDPVKIMLLLSIITAIVSSVLDNVTTVLILTPITILIASQLGLSPIPFVITLAMSSNIGGTATLVGDPPNVMIGSAVNLTFMDFLVNLGPIVVICMGISLFAYKLLFSKQLHVAEDRKQFVMQLDETHSIIDKKLMYRTLFILLMIVVAFLIHGTLGVLPATIAMLGAFLMLMINPHLDVHAVLMDDVEWVTIFFFIGLFIIVGALEKVGIITIFANYIIKITQGNIPLMAGVILWASGVISAFLDNIPYVAALIPVIKHMSAQFGAEAVSPLWWALSLGACLGGNGTLIGASANVVAAGICAKSGHQISFKMFFKYGAIITVINLLASTVYLYLRYFYHVIFA